MTKQKSLSTESYVWYYRAFLLSLLVIGGVWLRSGFEKMAEGKFVSSLGMVLNKFASENPNSAYKEFLLNTAVPNASFFGYAVMWGELFSGITLVGVTLYLLTQRHVNRRLGIIIGLGLIIGFILNLNFWLAAGWMSSSTDGLNLLMMALEAIGLLVVVKELKK